MEKQYKTHAPLPSQPQYGWSHTAMPERALRGSPGSGAGASRPGTSGTRPMGMEGTMLYQKTIDNSRLHYRHDPQDRRFLRRNLSLAMFVGLVILAFSGPRLWVRQAGYRQAELVQTIERLTVVRNTLKVEKGRLEDLRRVAAIAERSGLRETEEASYTWFAPVYDEAGVDAEVAQLLGGEGQFNED